MASDRERSESQSDDVFAMCRAGDLQNLQDFYAEYPDADINTRNEERETLLVCCAKRLNKKWKLPFGGQFAEICELLVRRGINVDLQDAYENSAVYYAVERYALDTVKLLLGKNARLDQPGRNNPSALELIAQRGELDWVRAVCETSGCESDDSRPSAMVALLHHLLATKNESCICWICEHYPEVIQGTTRTDSLTALHVAVLKHNVEAFSILLEFNANMDAVDEDGHTPLHYTVVHGHADLLVLLVTKGAQVSCQDIDGASPLHYAVSTHLSDVSKGDFGEQLLSDIIIECLLSYGASVTLPDNNGRTPLHWAANADNANACREMVSKGCPINSTCNDGLTALHIAASRGYTECIRVLVVECGANVNMTDHAGNTPLLYTLSGQHVDCAELLMCDGALPDVSNTHGSVLAHYAAAHGLTNALEILHKYEASLEHEDTDGNRPLHKAAFNNQIEAVDYLLKCKCEVNVRNKEGLTPLHFAASLGSVSICECLISAGATVNQIFQDGDYNEFLTPLDFAIANNQAECVQFLKIVHGNQGRTIATRAARKIQKTWREKRINHNVPKELETDNTSPANVTVADGEKRGSKRKEKVSKRDKIARSGLCEISDIKSSHRRRTKVHSIKPDENKTAVLQLPHIEDTRDLIGRPKDGTVAQVKKEKVKKTKTHHDVEKDLNDALAIEVTQAEKLTKELEELKSNLAMRSNNFDERLKEIEIKLRQTRP